MAVALPSRQFVTKQFSEGLSLPRKPPPCRLNGSSSSSFSLDSQLLRPLPTSRAVELAWMSYGPTLNRLAGPSTFTANLDPEPWSGSGFHSPWRSFPPSSSPAVGNGWQYHSLTCRNWLPSGQPARRIRLRALRGHPCSGYATDWCPWSSWIAGSGCASGMNAPRAERS